MSSIADILSELECSICSEYMTGHVFQCAAGHNLCSRCLEKLYVCQTCDGPLETTRNYSLERIAEKIKAPCQNAGEGCKINSSFRELNEHHKTCSYRNYDCQLEQCKWNGRRSALLAHAQEKHKNCCIENKWETSWKRNEATDKVMMFQIEEVIFYIHQKVKDETIYWILQYLGAPEEAENYRYNIRFDTSGELDLSIADRCCTDLQTIEEIIEKKVCIHLPLSLLERYIDEGTGQVYFDVSVETKGNITSSVTSTPATSILPCQTYHCQHLDCEMKGTEFMRNTFIEHAQFWHGAYYIHPLHNSWNQNLTRQGVRWLVEHEGSFFYAIQTGEFNEATFFYIVQYVGNPEEAKKFYYEIYWSDPLVRYNSHACQDETQNIIEVMKKRECICLPSSQFKRHSITIFIKQK